MMEAIRVGDICCAPAVLAECVTDSVSRREPIEIGASYRAGIAATVQLVQSLSGADDDAVQRMVAYGQLCHLIVVAGLVELDDEWARVISHGFRHG
jgi:hypothetical protein